MSPRQPVLAPRLWPETWYISWMILSRVGGGSCSPICKRGCIRQMDSCSICSASRRGCSCVSPGPWWGTSAPLAAASSKGFSGVKGLGVCVGGVAAAGQEVDGEPHMNILSFASYIICCFGVRAIASPRGKKCSEIPQTLQYRFCFTMRQKRSLCVRAERNSLVPQPPQNLNVNYLHPCVFT